MTKGPFRIRPEKSEALFEGTMNKNGVPHGFCRIISPDGDLDFYGCFVNGALVGNCWKGLLGGKFLKEKKNSVRKLGRFAKLSLY